MKKGDEIEIIEINERRYEGVFIKIDNAVWKPKRKSEPTLHIEINDDYLGAIPVRLIKSIKII